MAIKVQPTQLGEALRRRDAKNGAVVRMAAKVAAELGRSLLAKKTPVDTGALKARWRVGSGRGQMPTLVNDTPYAGVVEEGARPHGVSVEGQHAIKLWFMRKLHLTEQEAGARMQALVQRMLAKGQPGTHFVRDAMPELNKLLQDTLEGLLKQYASGPV